jgi:hypothetical protein
MTRTWLVILAMTACDEPLVTNEQAPAAPPRAEPPAVRLDKLPEPPRVAPEPARPGEPTPQVAQAIDAGTAPQRITTFEAYAPMSLAIAGDTLLWTDPRGSLWSMPSRGGTPVELSNQHMPGRPMYMNLAAHDGAIIASRAGDLVRVGLPAGPLQPLGLDLGTDSLLELVSDGTAIYATSFEHASAIYKIEAGQKTKLLDHKRAGLAVVGDTLYAVSYSTGVLVAIKTSGGRPRTITRGLAKTTGFAADDKAAYVWGERDRAIRRIDLKTGKATILANEGFDNTDVLVSDGAWIYAHSWLGEGKSTFVRIAKDGSGVQVLASDLSAPYDIAVDDEAVFVSVRDSNKIVRFDKRAIEPL